MIPVTSVLVLGLVAAISCLPPPTPRSSTPGAATPRHQTLNVLGLSQRLSAAVAPLLDAFLTPIVENLPDEYLEELAESIKTEQLANLGPDPLIHGFRYFEDEDRLQHHDDTGTDPVGREQ